MDEFLKRIDAHLAQGNELMARIDEHMARGNEHMARGNEQMARGNEQMARGNEQMARGNEHMARGNELMDEVRREIALSRAQSANHQRALEVMVESLTRMGGAIRDVSDEARAQTAAIFKLIDRLDGGTSPA